MKVLIIGGAGMIGRKLAERLAKDGAIAGKPVSKLTLYDVVPATAPAGAKMPVAIATGDLPAAGEAD
jgi:nucleoside-diphosphate-sugar epimerase